MGRKKKGIDMRIYKMPALLAVFVLLAACAGGIGNIGTRSGPEKQLRNAGLPSVEVVGIQVSVPQTLTVSEANSYKPRADIVWRGDPLGNRHQQVRAILEMAAQDALSDLNGNLPIVIHLEVRKFHAITQRTRATIGGTHAIDFFLSVTNGQTGDTIIEPFFVSTNLKAFGGEDAMIAEARGETQKVRITDHLTALIRAELTSRPIELVGQ